MLLDDPYLLDDRIKGTESYKVKLYVSRKAAGDISINFNNKIVQGFLFLPYSVQQLVEIIYNSSLKQLVLEFSDNTNSLRKIKIFNSSLEQQFNFSFLLQENMGVAAQSVLIPLIQYNSNQTIQQVKNLHLDIDIQTDLNNQQSRQLIDKLATLTNINFTISFTAQTKTTKYLIETHSNKHYISTKQSDGVDKKALYISLNAGDDIYFIDDYNHITINSATIANNATLSDLIIFQLPTPELLDIRCLGQGNDIIIEYRNIAQPVYEYYNPSLRPPYNNKLILDFREIKLKDIIFRGVGDNMHLMSPGNKTVILPNWDIDNYHRIMLLPKEGILNNKLLDLTNCTIIQLMLQPHLSMNATMDISLCDKATVTNRGFQSFQFCKNQCISKADLPQFGKIILKNNGNATRNFKVINGNVTYGLKIENDGFNWRKVDTGQTLLILIPENKKIHVLEAKDLNNYNALSIPQIDKALNLDFNQQRGHLILKLKNLNKLIIIKDFYNHTLSQQLVTINLREESINALELHNKFTQAQVIDSPYVIYDLNPVVPQFKIKLSINQPNDTGKVAILDLHKVKKVENIAFSKREQDLIIVCKSSNDQGVILTNTIEIINWNSQLINRAILLHNGQMFNLIKCTTQQLHGLNLSLYVDHSQDECGIERYRSKREVNDLGKQQNLEGKVTNSGSRPALWGVERLLAIGSIFNTIKNIVEKWLSNSLPDLSTAEQLPAQVVQVADSLQDKSQIFPDTRNPLPQSKQQQTNTPMNLQADIITALEVLEQCNNAHYDSGQDSHAKNSQDENIRADKAPICYAKPSQCHTTIFEDCISKAVYISNEHQTFIVQQTECTGYKGKFTLLPKIDNPGMFYKRENFPYPKGSCHIMQHDNQPSVVCEGEYSYLKYQSDNPEPFNSLIRFHKQDTRLKFFNNLLIPVTYLVHYTGIVPEIIEHGFLGGVLSCLGKYGQMVMYSKEATQLTQKAVEHYLDVAQKCIKTLDKLVNISNKLRKQMVEQKIYNLKKEVASLPPDNTFNEATFNELINERKNEITKSEFKWKSSGLIAPTWPWLRKLCGMHDVGVRLDEAEKLSSKLHQLYILQGKQLLSKYQQYEEKIEEEIFNEIITDLQELNKIRLKEKEYKLAQEYSWRIKWQTKDKQNKIRIEEIENECQNNDQMRERFLTNWQDSIDDTKQELQSLINSIQTNAKITIEQKAQIQAAYHLTNDIILNNLEYINEQKLSTPLQTELQEMQLTHKGLEETFEMLEDGDFFTLLVKILCKESLGQNFRDSNYDYLHEDQSQSRILFADDEKITAYISKMQNNNNCTNDLIIQAISDQFKQTIIRIDLDNDDITLFSSSNITNTSTIVIARTNEERYALLEMTNETMFREFYEDYLENKV